MGVSRVHRLIRLVTVLQSGRARSVAELTEELGISRRTVFRDLQMLQEAGIPCYHEPGRGYRIRDSFFLPPISLTIPETLGLMIFGKTAAARRDRPLSGPGLSAVYKLINTVPEPIREACSDLMAHVSVDPGPMVETPGESDHYLTLQRCVDERRVCQVQYQSPVEDGPLSCKLKPYALHFAARAWYVLAGTDVHAEVRTFKVARFSSIEPANVFFERPSDFDPGAKLGKAWQLIPEGQEHDIELEFSARVGTNVAEVRWHPSQRHELLEDGRCWMWLCVDGLGEIAWWICGYADQVIIHRPEALRQRVRSMLEGALTNHEPGSPRSFEK
jgi:proteasome accessory factor B